MSGATAAASTDRLTFRVPEHNGTGVLLLDSAGNPVENNRVLPYGEPFRAVSGSTNDDKFTTYNRDPDTGLDYAMARHYASKYGAFLSPDPGHVGANLLNPVSWNAYAYGWVDPITHVDPDGRRIELSLDFENRYEAFDAIRSTVGVDAAAQLHIAMEDGGYYLKVDDLFAFMGANAVAQEFARIIMSDEIVHFRVVSIYAETNFGNRVSLLEANAVGMTHRFGGDVWVYVKSEHSAGGYGRVSPLKMEGALEGEPTRGLIELIFGSYNNLEITTAHEFGHAYYLMTHPNGSVDDDQSNRFAVDLENKERRLLQPYGGAPTRTKH